MQALSVTLRKRLSSSMPLFRLSSNLVAHLSSTTSSCSPLLFNSLPSPACGSSIVTNTSTGASSTLYLLSAPWSTIQCRGMKVSSSDVRVGNIIEKQGRIYEVLKVEHSHEGRGKATIKVELRDIGQGNKVTQRMGTDEDIERVYVREKMLMYMCMDHDGTVVLME